MITVNELLHHLKTKAAIADLFGVSPQAITQWGDDEPIPPAQELRLRLELMPSIFGFKHGKGMVHKNNGGRAA